MICHQVHGKLQTIVNGIVNAPPTPQKMLTLGSAPKDLRCIRCYIIVTYIANLHCCVIAVHVHWPSRQIGVSTKKNMQVGLELPEGASIASGCAFFLTPTRNAAVNFIREQQMLATWLAGCELTNCEKQNCNWLFKLFHGYRCSYLSICSIH